MHFVSKYGREKRFTYQKIIFNYLHRLLMDLGSGRRARKSDSDSRFRFIFPALWRRARVLTFPISVDHNTCDEFKIPKKADLSTFYSALHRQKIYKKLHER